MPNPDATLIREFNHCRSEPAFAALVERHIGLVFATALRQVGDRVIAEEITQNVFVALAQSAGKLGRHPTLAGWLHRTTLNKSRERLRSELRRRRREEAAVSLDLARVEGESVWSSLIPLLDEALLELREADRNAVILRFMEEQNFAQVGAALGVGEDAARKRVERCLDHLGAFFRRHGLAVPVLVAGAPLFALSSQAAPAGLSGMATSAGLAAAGGATGTVAFVKGVLKIMAWTKAKTVVVVGIGLALTTGTVTYTVHKIRSLRPENRVVWRLDGRILESEPPVVLIRPAQPVPGQSGGYYWLNDGRIIAMHRQLPFLLSRAYDTKWTRMIFTERLPEDYYDFMVGVRADPRHALQDAVRTKFGLAGRRETREMDVVRLTQVRAEASGLRPVQTLRGSTNEKPGRWEFRGVRMSALTDKLEEYLGKPVLDETGLTNLFDIDLTWQGKRVDPPSDQILHQAALDQLGLSLEPDTRSLDVVIIEKAR